MTSRKHQRQLKSLHLRLIIFKYASYILRRRVAKIHEGLGPCSRAFVTQRFEGSDEGLTLETSAL